MGGDLFLRAALPGPGEARSKRQESRTNECKNKETEGEPSLFGGTKGASDKAGTTSNFVR